MLTNKHNHADQIYWSHYSLLPHVSAVDS